MFSAVAAGSSPVWSEVLESSMQLVTRGALFGDSSTTTASATGSKGAEVTPNAVSVSKGGQICCPATGFRVRNKREWQWYFRWVRAARIVSVL